jgi:Na+-translocating ferredoxin:NAD+ oxidoreductase subunit A
MAIINNLALAQFLGLCGFFRVSTKLNNAVGMGLAVTLVMSVVSVVGWLINRYVLIPFGAAYMNITMYLLVIAALVQLTEVFIKRTNLTLYNAFGIYLPLITINSTVLGIVLINEGQNYTMLEGTFAALGGGLGYLVVLIIMSTIRERLKLSDVPRSMTGFPIAMIVGMILGLAFFGFGGML